MLKKTTGLLVAGVAVYAFGVGMRADSRSATADTGDVVAVDASDVFIPQGFDNNDEAQVVLDGYLPSACYQVTKPLVNVDTAGLLITITPQARLYDGPCIQSLVPYSSEVDLGVLPIGQYAIKVAGNKDIQDTLTIKESPNSGPDDVAYAPVDTVTIDTVVSANRPVAIISGRLTDTCMQVGEVKVQNSGKTFEILPQLIVQERNDCQKLETPFRVPVELAPGSGPALNQGRYLAHVRSLNGKAVNTLFSVVPTKKK